MEVSMSYPQEDLESILAARRYLYSLFQSLLGNEPSSEQFQAISFPLVREAFAILALEDTDGFLCVLEQMSVDNAELKGEYTRLFIGPNKLPAPPWESVYTTGERVIFQRSTLEIRNFYRSQGLIPRMYPKVADDHIALELDFLRLLAERALTAFQTNERESYQEALAASLDFLEEHLLKWVERFADDLMESKKGAFYPLAAQALVSFATGDAAVLCDLREAK
jgi:TorA maturation chaperone TorD